MPDIMRARINDGGTFVSGDACCGNNSADSPLEILARNGGHSASQPRVAYHLLTGSGGAHPNAPPFCAVQH